MFGKHWISVIVAGVAAGLFLFAPVVAVLASQHDEQHQTGAENTDAAPSPKPDGFIESANGNAAEAEENERGQAQREYAPAPRFWLFGDSIAQWIMATVTGLATILVWITLRVTGRMLNESRRATHAAIRAARSADRTAKTTREVGEAQIRAYLSIVFRDAAFNDNITEGASLTLAGKIGNTGHSPAYKMRCYASLHSKLTEFDEVNVVERLAFAMDSYLPPGGGSEKVYTIRMKFNDHGIDKSSTSSLWVNVIVFYTDVLGIDCKSFFRAQFCYRTSQPVPICDFAKAFSDNKVALSSQ